MVMTARPPENGSTLRVVRVPGKGRGIVAGRPIAAREVVDAAPVVVIPARDRPFVEQTALGRFCFVWDDVTGSPAVALGRASLLDHSYEPNVVSEKRIGPRLIAFVALRDIVSGEELTLNYNGEVDGREPVGFDVEEP